MRFHSLIIGLLSNRAASAFVTRHAVLQTAATPATTKIPYRVIQQDQNRHFMGFFSNLFQGPATASAQDIKVALQNVAKTEVTVIDVRSPDEISKDGKVTIDGCKWINAPASPFGCPDLASNAESILPDKNAIRNKNSAPIILYCASGMRATKAKQVLEKQGYTNVMNAGGASHLRSLGL